MSKYEIRDGVAVIPYGVTEIEERAFYGCSGLTSVTIPSSVKKIGYGAFYGCSGLTSVTIPSSVTEIGCEVFFRLVFRRVFRLQRSDECILSG